MSYAPYYSVVGVSVLDHTLSHHGVGYFDEACHVSALHVVDVAIGTGTVLHARGVDVLHDALELLVHLVSAPA